MSYAVILKRQSRRERLLTENYARFLKTETIFVSGI